MSLSSAFPCVPIGRKGLGLRDGSTRGSWRDDQESGTFRRYNETNPWSREIAATLRIVMAEFNRLPAMANASCEPMRRLKPGARHSAGEVSRAMMKVVGERNAASLGQTTPSGCFSGASALVFGTLLSPVLQLTNKDTVSLQDSQYKKNI
ncbi:hypothetical protein RRG08_032906 [Elysia crispata]|uniref:Uncharacterized protein n=1 Tax=Elysia crispata TaxID=231223 RepID=A0AAE1A6D3_9GAST|nr:hypothetical protein RRG08_032906 [Elysia crispata]